ncbi:hypothetical protein [Streptomyces sp. NPDC047315]|uniref:hypothetical protein n=1 Tax=Streptomyces sp. NPDC047315 TaxID=3155142 RepID=UPI0033DF87DE
MSWQRTAPSPARRMVLSLLVWWAGFTAVLWLLGLFLDGPSSLVACAASAALLLTLGELGYRLNRRFSRGPRGRGRSTRR